MDAALEAQNVALTMPNGTERPIDARLLERRFNAFSLRKQGGTYRQIAAALAGQDGVSEKYGESNAYNDVQWVVDHFKSDLYESVEFVRLMELETLRDMQSRLWPRAQSGDYAAIDRIFTIMEKRARYLGLYSKDAPAQAAGLQVNVNGLTGEQQAAVEVRYVDYRVALRGVAQQNDMLDEIEAQSRALDEGEVAGGYGDPTTALPGASADYLAIAHASPGPDADRPASGQDEGAGDGEALG